MNVSNAFEEIIKDTINTGHNSPNLLHTKKGLDYKNNKSN